MDGLEHSNFDRDYSGSAGILPGTESRHKANGYRMIQTIEIQDFRCFERMKLDNLKRVNVITGANASGKSALIEAIYLCVNATATALQNIGNSRFQAQPLVFGGPGGLPVAIGMQSSNSNYDHLFRSKKTEQGINIAPRIRISATDSENASFTLGILYQGQDNTTPVPVIRRPGGVAIQRPLIFERTKKSPLGMTTDSNIAITVNQFGQMQQPPAEPFGPAAYIFGAGMDYAEQDDVTWFSQLKEANEVESIISFIKEEFPLISDIEVLAPAGSNGLYAMMRDGSWRRIATISTGIYKVISILLGFAHIRDGIVLIDEIENGIFYEKYGAVWRILYKFAQQTNNQIFVSSHSVECLNELTPIMTGNEEDFCLLRAERQDDGCEVQYIAGSSMAAALRGRNEVRGATLGLEDDSK